MQTVGEDLVSALLAVDGVAAASVEPLGEGPGTLRLQLTPGSDEVAVAGAVNRVLRSRFGLAVDADRVQVLDRPGPPQVAAQLAATRSAVRLTPAVSVLAPATSALRTASGRSRLSVASPLPRPVLVDPPARASFVEVDTITEGRTPTPARVEPDAADDAPRGKVDRPARLVIQRVQLLSAGLGVTATVTLARDETAYAGEAEGSATTSGVHRSVAVATLRAVEQVAAGAARFEVEHVELTRLGTEATAVVLVTMLTGRSTLRLTGASVVREDVRQAVIRAALAAVNRRLEMLLEDQAAPDAEES